MSEESAHMDDIDKFLMGQMGDFEQGLFEHRMAQDQDLKFEVEVRKKALEMIEFQRALALKDYIRKNTPHKRILTFWQQVAVYSSAACLIIFTISWAVLSIYFPNNDLTNQISAVTEKKEINKDALDSGMDESTNLNELKNDNQPLTEPEILNMTDSVSIGAIGQEEGLTTMPVPSQNEVDEDDVSGVEDSYVIKSDILVQDTIFYAFNYSYNTVAADAKKPTAAPSANNLETYKTTKAKTVKEIEDTVTPGLIKNQSVNIRVEFWKSPINYKGYKYNGIKLMLYGMVSNPKMKFKILNDELYMLTGDQVFHIVKEDRFNSFWPETDKNLIKLIK